eukprot:CAMPEP_0197029852 /NCGR_PEP_ID=MMETSP1384-20130603/9212_1 /TAXON_ID=29189 /ORGANISM="Ammonia sp." /LENGTH=306 /DNA_ID=CAMNT_0042459091 /DNA_START=95 /DNA_END=1015 /DNA_ORIENTATION=+
MTDYEAEQADELESLECLYPTTFKRDKDDPNSKFVIEVAPHQDSDEPNHVAIKLHVSYTAKYPEESANFRIEIMKGLTDKQLPELNELIKSTTADNLGQPMMFAICTELQEWLIQHNIPGDTSLHDQMKAQKELKARLQRLTYGDEEKTDDHTQAEAHCVTDFDVASYQRAKGTPVTEKAFAKWAKEFLKTYRQQQQEEFDKVFGVDDKRDKLTGVQIFQQKAKEKLNLDTEDIGNSQDEEEEEQQVEQQEETQNGSTEKKKKKKSKKKKEKTVVVGDVNGKTNDSKTVVISDQSLFLDDMDMPDF